MVYIFSILGFVTGFAIGIGTINVILRRHSNDDLAQDKSLRWKYGTLVWVFSGIGGYLGFWLYQNYFL